MFIREVYVKLGKSGETDHPGLQKMQQLHWRRSCIIIITYLWNQKKFLATFNHPLIIISDRINLQGNQQKMQSDFFIQ